MNLSLANMKLCFRVFACFAFIASFNAPQLSPLWSLLSKQECTVWVGLLLALACVEEWDKDRIQVSRVAAGFLTV